LSADRVFEGLSHETRRRIIKALGEAGPLPYKRLLEVAGVETGVLNYHLGKLKGLVEKREDGRYALTEEGLLAYRVLLCYEGGGSQTSTSGKSAVAALKDVYFHPQRVFSSPEAYGEYVAIPAVMLFLLEYAVSGSLHAAMVFTLAPLMATAAIALVVYGAVPLSIKKLLMGYPATLSPLCLVPVLEFALSEVAAPSRALTLASGAVIAVYVVYNMLFVREVYGLDYLKSLIVSLANMAALAYFLRQAGIVYLPLFL